MPILKVINLLFFFLVSVCSESLYEDEAFDQRQLAALVVSKVNIDFSPICNMISTTTLWL